MREKLDVFLPAYGAAPTAELVATVMSSPLVNRMFLLTREDSGKKSNISCLPAGQFGSTSMLRAVAEKASGDYLLLGLCENSLRMNANGLKRLFGAMACCDAPVAYADYEEEKDGMGHPHPLIDYQKGSLGTRFNFGPFVLLSTEALKEYLAQPHLNDYSTAALYDLRLQLSTRHDFLHLIEPVCTLSDAKLQPLEAVADDEAEQVLNDFLSEAGALLDTSSLESADLDEQPFPCEASVIIPVYNRETTIGDAVRSALGQKTSFKFNVIVVDNHSTDSTSEILRRCAQSDPRLIVLQPERTDLSIGGCWNEAVRDGHCGRFAVQLDSDDLYASDRTLQKLVDAFHLEKAAMVVGSYRVTDLRGHELRADIVDHREWANGNGNNNVLRMNGVGAPRAFFTPLLRQMPFPNVGYGEDYAVALSFSRRYKVARIFEPLYIVRRGCDNVTARHTIEERNRSDYYKDRLRTLELDVRRQMLAGKADFLKGDALSRLFDRQLAIWPEVRQRYASLRHVQEKQLGLFKAQFNPDRMVSTGAKVDKQSIAARPCFLCQNNRPKVQMVRHLDAHFDLMVNPYPVLPCHFTVPSRRHRRQAIADCLGEMFKLLTAYPGLLVFYNGPQSGASAPDHLHLQAGTSGNLPIQTAWKQLSRDMDILFEANEDEYIASVKKYPCAVLAIRSKTREAFISLFSCVVKSLPKKKTDTEPRLNAVAWREGEAYWTVVFPRSKHRPDCYDAEGEKRLVVSPGALDMAGLTVLPRKEDYDKITQEDLLNIIREVSLSDEEMAGVREQIKKRAMNAEKKSLVYDHQPQVSVGIVSGQKIEFSLNTAYEAKGEKIVGDQTVEFAEGGILWNGNQYRELTFRPMGSDASFSLKDVTIGVNFHWERKETQTFRGTLHLVVEAGKICAINKLPVEEYLESVISSEMSATSSLELLKAHAVISRSWLLAQMEKRRKVKDSGNNFFSFVKKDDRLVKWYDREDHTIFDVCADDHCQRYQGITKETSPHVVEAVKQTKGQVLTSEGEICDARFSKCCGGATEEFQYCWEDTPKSYLKAVVDTPDEQTLPDLTNEAEAEKWIRTSPPSFCNTTDKKVLSQVLNDYDQETTDFYRWHVDYTQEEVQKLLSEKLKMNFGRIKDLVPLERGKSGRICLLQIVGTEKTFAIGKELEIRRALSTSHLYSSAFVVDKFDLDADGVPARFRITGAGWGHGVGLCQIGAAVMGEKGYNYKQILTHYYPGAEISKLYK